MWGFFSSSGIDLENWEMLGNGLGMVGNDGEWWGIVGKGCEWLRMGGNVGK